MPLEIDVMDVSETCLEESLSQSHGCDLLSKDTVMSPMIINPMFEVTGKKKDKGAPTNLRKRRKIALSTIPRQW